MSGSEVDITYLREWVGQQQEAMQRVDCFPARALAGLLDWDDVPKDGDDLPMPWHWLYFLEAPASAATASDGHPQRGGFLPPVPLPKRMWASGEIAAEFPLKIGQEACKRSTVKSVELKRGRSGTLVFVTVEHVLSQNDRTCLRELQHIVYREAQASAAPLSAAHSAQDVAQWRRELRPDPVMLFRFSALTFNGHRIHYDRDYAMGTESYPGLVVQGPLLATLLMDLLRRHCPKARISRFNFRTMRPAFDGDALVLNGYENDGGLGARLWTSDASGVAGMDVNVWMT